MKSAAECLLSFESRDVKDYFGSFYIVSKQDSKSSSKGKSLHLVEDSQWVEVPRGNFELICRSIPVQDNIPKKSENYMLSSGFELT